MPVNIVEVDEVHLGLSISKQAFERAGHHPSPVIENCMDCYALYLVNNAIRVYLERLNKAAEVELAARTWVQGPEAR